jgi:hypothetical protein
MTTSSETTQISAVMSNNPTIRGIERLILGALVVLAFFSGGPQMIYPCVCEEGSSLDGSAFDGSTLEGSVEATVAAELLPTDESVDDVELDVVDDLVEDGSGDLPEL